MPQANYNVSTEEIIGQGLTLFQRAVDKRIPKSWQGRVILPLSGGLDSRLLLWLTQAFSDRLELFTHGQIDCRDHVYADRVASWLDLQHQHRLVELNPDWAGAHAREAVWLNDGQVNMRNATLLGIGAELGNESVPFLNGIIGQHMALGVGGFAGSDDLKMIDDQAEWRRRTLASSGVESGLKYFEHFMPERRVPRLICSIPTRQLWRTFQTNVGLFRQKLI